MSPPTLHPENLIMNNRVSEDIYAQGQAHGGDVWGAARRLGLEVDQVLDLSASLNPLGPPPGLMEELGRTFGLICLYPDRQCLSLRQALARYHGLEAMNFLPGNGAPSLFTLLARALTSRDVVVMAPAFGEIGRSLALSGSHFHFHLLNARDQFAPTTHDLEKIWELSPNCIYLSNPLTPSGGLVDPEVLAALMTQARARNAWVVIDESFMPFAPEEARDWAPAQVNNYPRLVVLRSLAKFYCLVGLRLSYLMCHPQTTLHLAPLGEPWSVSTPAQMAGVYCLGQDEFAHKTRRAITAWRESLTAGLAQRGLMVLPSQVNYLLAALPHHGPSAAQVAAACLEQGVLLRDCANIPGCHDHHLRLAVCPEEDQERLFAALDKALAD